jgi:chromosome segregation ATPase
LRLDDSIGEKEKAFKENEVLLDGAKQLQERISCLEHEGEQHLVELRQLENSLASANSEMDDAGNKLNDVSVKYPRFRKFEISVKYSKP